jgi:hypothetical protein
MNLFDRTVYLTIFAIIILTPACQRPPLKSEVISITVIKSLFNPAAQSYISRLEKKAIEDFCKSFEINT